MAGGLCVLGLSAASCGALPQAPGADTESAGSSAQASGNAQGTTVTAPDPTETTSTSGGTGTGTTEGSTAATATTRGTEASTAAGTGTSTSTGDETSSDPWLPSGCPVGSPEAWILCQDFDRIEDPALELAYWQVVGDGIGVEPDPQDPGGQRLRLTHEPGVGFGGAASLRFGGGPSAPTVAAMEREFSEVWVRFSFRKEFGFPERPVGAIAVLGSLVTPPMLAAFELQLIGEDDGSPTARGVTCINDDVFTCDGTDDVEQGDLSEIFEVSGAAEFFGLATNGQKRCIEVRAHLDDPALSNGEITVWVDGKEQLSDTGVTWKNGWSDLGLNVVRFAALAEPADVPATFYIDDVVVATDRVDCP